MYLIEKLQYWEISTQRTNQILEDREPGFFPYAPLQQEQDQIQDDALDTSGYHEAANTTWIK